MNGKYLVNFKAPIGGVEASLTVCGENALQVVEDARQLLALVRAVPGEGIPAQPLASREEAPAQEPAAGSPAPNGHAPECPEHKRGLPSKYGEWLYCPAELEDGTRCKWNTKPKKAAKA